MAPKIIFSRLASSSYADIENQVFSAVEDALKDTLSLHTNDADFIIETRYRSRKSNADKEELPKNNIHTDTELDIVSLLGKSGNVLLSHSLRDRNYYGKKRRPLPEAEHFKCIFVPGQWLRRRLLEKQHFENNPHVVVAVGHPRIDILRRMQATRPARKNPETADGKSDGRLRVLWAPGYGLTNDPEDLPSASTYPSFLNCADQFRPWCDLVLIPHPRDRIAAEPDQSIDRSAVTEELLDCDAVISDSSSIIFEAWALGKPVIFPRWLIADKVIVRSPGSAEAYIHENRIGYHPESPEQLVEILREGQLSIGEDVKIFMTDYLETYHRGESVSLIASTLRRLADPAEMARHQAKEEVLSSALSMVSALGKKAIVGSRGLPRASIQLLQSFFMAGDYQVLGNMISTLRQSSSSKGFLIELAAIEVEAALAQGMIVTAEAMIARLPEPASWYFKARLSLLRNAPLEAVAHLEAYLRSGGRSFSAFKILVSALGMLNEHDRQWHLLRQMWASYPAPETLELMASCAACESDYAVIRQARAALEKSLGKINPLSMSAELTLVQHLNQKGARDFAVAKALSVARNGSLASDTFDGWHSGAGMPTMLYPFEGFAAAQLRLSGSRRADAIRQLLPLIRKSGLPLFLSRQTLRSWLEDTNATQRMSEAVELGMLVGPDSGLALANLGRVLNMEPLRAKPSADVRVFRHLNGTQIVVRMYHPADQHGYVFEEAKSFIHVPKFEIVWQSRNDESAPVPDDIERYMAAVFEADGRSRLPTPESDQTRDNLVIHLCHRFITASGDGDTDRLSFLARELKRFGIHGPELYLAGMEKNYLPAELPEIMQRTRFILHLGDGAESEFHIDLWHDYVKHADPDALLAIRSKPLFDLLRKTRPDLDAVYIKSGIEAEWLVTSCPRLAGILYVSNTGSTVHFLRFNHLSHVWLGHGDSEKAASCHKFFRAYDEIWCAGMAQIDRFRNAGMAHGSLRFRVVGRPMLRKLIEEASKPTSETFLYLPTWEGFQTEQDYTSIAHSVRFVPGIVELTGQDALVKFHPWTGQRVPAHRDVEQKLASINSGNNASIRVLDRRQPVVDMMSSANFLVADVSSVVSDFLSTARPIFLYMPDRKGLRMTTSAMPMSAYCYVFQTEDELLDLVRTVILEGKDWLREQRLQARNYFVDIEQTVCEGFEGALHDLMTEHDNQALPWSPVGHQVPSVSPLQRPMIVGHRGAKMLHAENSLSGFKAVAGMKGLDAVEFDLHLTSDGEIAVLHDPTLDRTTDASGPVNRRTMRDLQNLRLKSIDPKAGTFLDEGVPKLEEVLDVLAPTGLDMFIELKNDALGNSYAGLPEKTLAILHARNLLDRCTLTSFSPGVLNHIRYLNRNVRLLASVNYRSIEMMGGVHRCLETFSQISGCGVTLQYEALTRLRDAGADLDYRRFGMWVVNTPEQIALAISMGVRQIFTDTPDLAISALREHAAFQTDKS